MRDGRRLLNSKCLYFIWEREIVENYQEKYWCFLKFSHKISPILVVRTIISNILILIITILFVLSLNYFQFHYDRNRTISSRCSVGIQWLYTCRWQVVYLLPQEYRSKSSYCLEVGTLNTGVELVSYTWYYSTSLPSTAKEGPMKHCCRHNTCFISL